jgi:hypothetical protein
MAEGSSFIQEMISGLLLSEISNKVEKWISKDSISTLSLMCLCI